MELENEICDGYIEAAFWAEELDVGPDIELSPEGREKALADCRKFYQSCKGLIEYLCEHDVMSADLIGHNFWLTRCHHGTGFWDRDYLDSHVREFLTKKSHQFGGSYLYVGDDGLAYFA